METLWASFLEFLGSEQAGAILRAVLTVLAGLILARLVSSGLGRVLAKQADAHRAMLLRRVSFYVVAGLFLATALVELGFNFGILLGAAGILTVAFGFASQTSASNVISGLFLLGEKAFAVGDVLKVGETTGEVLSIDLLSVKLRTFDNLFVRIPNENLIKSPFTNLTRFPIRRIDLQIGVAYKENMQRVLDVLVEVAHQNPLCLEEPQPLFIFQGFGDSALTFQFSVWAKREQFLDLKNSIQIEIKDAFDAHGIEIPFPHRTLYTGSVTEPFPVRVVGASPAEPA
jgi:small-conductance mechanosensitive channel